MTRENNCRFCSIINKDESPLDNAPQNVYDTILYETENFIVTPAIGSLVPGYIMILPKRHINSMSYLPRDELKELMSIKNMLCKYIYHYYNVYPIVFEHGSASNNLNRSGCCIEHAHWHIVPVSSIGISEFPEDISFTKMNEYEKIALFAGTPYLLYIDKTGDIYISTGNIIPSQFMRQWIAVKINKTEQWDWRQHAFLDNVRQTINAFKDIEYY